MLPVWRVRPSSRKKYKNDNKSSADVCLRIFAAEKMICGAIFEGKALKKCRFTGEKPRDIIEDRKDGGFAAVQK